MHETWFIAAQAIALIGWAALFVAPWIGRERAVPIARCVAALLCVLYLAFFLPNLSAIPKDGGYTLAALGRSFDTPALLLAGWIHYLVLDLWVGSWETEHAGVSGLPHAVLLLCLFATMMVGPLGLLLYLGVAAWKRSRPVIPA